MMRQEITPMLFTFTNGMVYRFIGAKLKNLILVDTKEKIMDCMQVGDTTVDIDIGLRDACSMVANFILDSPTKKHRPFCLKWKTS